MDEDAVGRDDLGVAEQFGRVLEIDAPERVGVGAPRGVRVVVERNGSVAELPRDPEGFDLFMAAAEQEQGASRAGRFGDVCQPFRDRQRGRGLKG